MRAFSGFGLALAVLVSGCVAPGTAPRPPDPRLAEAEEALLQELWDVAEARFAAIAVDADPQGLGARCHYWMGVCRRAQDDPVGARDAFGKALASGAPEWQARARIGLGDLAWDAGDRAAAREMYLTADPEGLPADDQARRARRLEPSDD